MRVGLPEAPVWGQLGDDSVTLAGPCDQEPKVSRQPVLIFPVFLSEQPSYSHTRVSGVTCILSTNRMARITSKASHRHKETCMWEKRGMSNSDLSVSP